MCTMTVIIICIVIIINEIIALRNDTTLKITVVIIYTGIYYSYCNASVNSRFPKSFCQLISTEHTYIPVRVTSVIIICTCIKHRIRFYHGYKLIRLNILYLLCIGEFFISSLSFLLGIKLKNICISIYDIIYRTIGFRRNLLTLLGFYDKSL